MGTRKRNIKILVVDDDERVRDFLSATLTQRGFSVEEAENGKEALEKATRNKLGIILLDCVMPIMDGFETCRRLRNGTKTHNIPIIFCTAKHISEVTKEDIKVDDYLEKPFSVDELCRKINKILRLPDRST